MMGEHGYWHPQLGYWQAISAPSEELVAAYPAGTVKVPLRPDAWSEWDGTAWRVNEVARLDTISADARAMRDNKLRTEVDPIVSNPLRWADLGAAQQTAWAAYRRALLDVPQQAGFPFDVAWPTKPE